MLNRAYSLVTVKDFDPIKRTFSGVATSPQADRLGDIIEAKGVTYRNPLPLMLYHAKDKPVGEASFSRTKDQTTTFRAVISTIDRESGVVKERLDEAVDSLAAKPPLIRGVSIGFRPLAQPTYNEETGGLIFSKIEVLELSMVVIPAHQDATIDLVKSLDAPYPYDSSDPAASGTGSGGVPPRSAGVAAPVVRALKGASRMKTIQDQISSFEATRQAKSARMTEIMTKSGDEGVTLDKDQEEEYDTLATEVKSVDNHLTRLHALDADLKSKAVAPAGRSTEEASNSRGGYKQVTVKENLPIGIEFARAVICKMNAYLSHRPAYEIAKERFPDNQRVHLYLKATVAAGTTTDANWASALVDQTNLASEFIEYLRPMTILGKFGQNGIPDLRHVPFNVRIVGQTTGGTANWVGQAKPKPLTKFHFAATTLAWAKIAAISVIADELARFSTPSAEMLVRDALGETIIAKMDTDFIDPAVAAVSNVSPASITNGLTALTSAGTSADNARTDIQNLLEAFILADNPDPSGLVLIMPNTLALALSIKVNSLGQREFPDLNMNGGRLLGIPVITSQYAANQSSYGNMVIAVNAREVFLSDDGQVSIDVSREAALEMLDSGFTQDQPTGASLVSLWQNNLLGIKAERYINWAKRRSSAVVYMDDVNWGAIGSPV